MKDDAPRGSQSTCLCVWQMEASVQTPIAGGVSTYFTRIQRRDDIHCKVQEKKHKYLSDVKHVLVPPGGSLSVVCNTSNIDDGICIHICLNTATSVPSVSNGP